MPVYQTNELIQKLQEQTENFLKEAISEWQMMPSEILLKQPTANKWSAAQCIEHLNSYGSYYLPAIEMAIKSSKKKGQKPLETFATGWLGNYFTNLMKPSDKMKKMAAPKAHTPIINLDVVKVVAEFIDQQEKMLKLLEDAKSISLSDTKVAISIAKFVKLKLGDVLLFLAAHNERHILQAEKAFINEKCKI